MYGSDWVKKKYASNLETLMYAIAIHNIKHATEKIRPSLHAFDECWRSPSPDIRATLSSGIAVARAELS